MEFPETFIRLIEFPTKEKINIISKKVSYAINKSLVAVISPFFFPSIKRESWIKRNLSPNK